MKNKTLREKIVELIGKIPPEWQTGNYNEKQCADEILNLISKEIKKNRPKERNIDFIEDKAFNLALKEYDKAIADTLK